MTIGIIANNPIAQPKNMINPIKIMKIFFDLTLVEMRVSVFI
jgi:hypothetical protein